MQMGIGFVIFGLLYLVAKYAEFITLLNVLSWLASSLILIVVVVFQNDIRRALIRMGAKAWLSSGRDQQTKVVDEVVEAATELARHRIGAIIAFERDANLLEFVRSDGILMESAISKELLVSLFLPESLNKTHDGAVLIRNLRISRAGMFFPMPEGRVADPSFGSRHRAAIGITEETDAVVVVVSEERGTITLCFGGSYVANIDGSNLRKTLLEQLGHKPDKERKPLMQRLGLRRRSPDEPEAPSTDKTTTKRAPQSSKKADRAAPASERRKPASAAPKSVRTPPASTASPRQEDSTSRSPSRPPPPAPSDAGERERPSRPSSDAKDTAKTPLKQTTKVSDEGDVVATPKEVEIGEASRTPPPSRVSKPMPQPKDRKTVENAAPESLDVPTQRTSVSKSMVPTELPGSSAATGRDEP
ncbi:MAG: DNA integrity scanning protein DisA nucleotide-binding domain protein [Deltaproteobacteria bacterium]|nr:DNA integrity scanning protein DisA nucleotide-binding domain protein [Deltaproteobacteria bacterium]MBW2537839.1 DNA integrity scanning protein DisA nucleotide-binding domain protein [Deltaproteobacteria bacterium]